MAPASARWTSWASRCGPSCACSGSSRFAACLLAWGCVLLGMHNSGLGWPRVRQLAGWPGPASCLWQGQVGADGDCLPAHCVPGRACPIHHYIGGRAQPKPWNGDHRAADGWGRHPGRTLLHQLVRAGQLSAGAALLRVRAGATGWQEVVSVAPSSPPPCRGPASAPQSTAGPAPTPTPTLTVAPCSPLVRPPPMQPCRAARFRGCRPDGPHPSSLPPATPTHPPHPHPVHPPHAALPSGRGPWLRSWCPASDGCLESRGCWATRPLASTSAS